MDQQHLKSVRLYERIADTIRGQIVAGELREGDRLPNERGIAERFGVSRPVVREAIRALTNDGLVQVRQGSGTYVAGYRRRMVADGGVCAATSRAGW